MTTGERLRQAREARNITVDDVARRTNIRPLFLQAIDEDDLATIPPSHRRLFVREYAKIVGIDPEVVLAELPEVSPAVVAPEAAARETAPYRSNEAETDRREYGEILRRLSSSGGTLRSMTGNPAFMLIGAATVLLLTVAIYYFVSGSDATAADGASAQIDSSANQTEILSGPESLAGDTVAGATPAVDIASGDSLTLEGRAVARVWYTIVMDGKRSETGTLDSGTVKTWRASEDFKVSLGNAGGLQLALNERPLGTLGPVSSVVRSKVIDREGIRTPGRRSTSASTAGTPAVRKAVAEVPAAREGRGRVTSVSSTRKAVAPRTEARRSTPRRGTRSNGRAAKRPAPMKEILTTQIR